MYAINVDCDNYADDFGEREGRVIGKLGKLISLSKLS
jgi:hypothetical protein